MWKKHVAAVFLDLDGALLDTGAEIDQIWRQWAQQRGLDFSSFAHRIHSQRIQEILKSVDPQLNADNESHALEAALYDAAGRYSKLRAGARALLDALAGTPWGVVTQASGNVAHARMAQAGLEAPPLLVGAEQVNSGRPDPEPYLMAARYYQVDPRDCLVIESDENGIRAARAAGMTVIALADRLPRHHLQRANVVIGNWHSIILHSQQVGPGQQGIWVEVVV